MKEALRPINPDEDIVEYSSSLARVLFKEILRDNGLPYFEGHLEDVAKLVKGFIISSEYTKSVVSAALLHDSAEDIEKIEVFNPFNEEDINDNKNADEQDIIENENRKRGNVDVIKDTDIKSDVRIVNGSCELSEKDDEERDEATKVKAERVIYLNDLFENAGVHRDYICYIVDLLTHRAGISYQDYLANLFAIPEAGRFRDLHILANGIKLADVKSNTAPEEIGAKVIDLVEEYKRMKNAEEDELREFYKRTKTIDAFLLKDDLSVDVDLFAATLHRRFKAKREANAINVLSYYIPHAENLFFNGYEETKRLFDLDIIRHVLIRICIDTMREYPGEDPLHVVNRLGENRNAPKIPGYKTIFREVREGVLNGIYEI